MRHYSDYSDYRFRGNVTWFADVIISSQSLQEVVREVAVNLINCFRDVLSDYPYVNSPART
jgi:hypothetical protein